MKNVLVLIHDDCGQEARLRAAIDVVRALEGHLICADVVATPELLAAADAPRFASLLASHDAVIERNNAERVRDRLKAEDVEYEWVDRRGEIAPTLAEIAGLADLIVVNRLLDHAEYPDMVDLTRRLLAKLNIPVLAVPEECERFAPEHGAVVLWDGSPDAEAALQAAVPLLRRAGEVTLLYADDNSLAASMKAGADYLRVNGITAHLVARDLFGSEPAVSLARYLERRTPGLIVMGAFSRGRLHEMIYGSVTTQMLVSAPAPVLLARRR